MRVLGITHDVLICSAAIVEDGKVLHAVAEERLDRQKQSRQFPTLAIEECLAQTNSDWDDLDEIAVAWNPGIEAETAPMSFVAQRRWRTDHFAQVPTRLIQQASRAAAPAITLSELWPGSPPITYVDHYLAHAGNAVFLAPYKECAVVVLDGRGERRTGLLGRAKDTNIEILDEINFPHSLGLFYGAVTQFLGFRPDSDEWKVMALGSYAEPENEFLGPMRKIITVDERGRFTLDLSFFEFNNFWDRRMYSDRFVHGFGAPRARNDEFSPRHQRLAAAMQKVFEEVAASVLTRLHERTGLDSLVATGGCFMNSVFNGKITEQTPFSNVFITSCPDDSGTSVGAALYVCAQKTGVRADGPVSDNYWGREFTDAECKAECDKFKLPNCEVLSDPSARAAQDLVDGKLIGWFQGRCEFGQRALGNRSILADPRREDAKDLVNAAVKYREGFRPFAPAILKGRVADYFECSAETEVPFMEKVLPFRVDKRSGVPAVVHVDGSGRLQTVDSNTSPRFCQLIEAFERKTGVPLVLNTSFNLNGEPIVYSPQDAIRTFYSCGLDVLYLGNCRVAK